MAVLWRSERVPTCSHVRVVVVAGRGAELSRYGRVVRRRQLNNRPRRTQQQRSGQGQRHRSRCVSELPPPLNRTHVASAAWRRAARERTGWWGGVNVVVHARKAGA